MKVCSANWEPSPNQSKISTEKSKCLWWMGLDLFNLLSSKHVHIIGYGIDDKWNLRVKQHHHLFPDMQNIQNSVCSNLSPLLWLYPFVVWYADAKVIYQRINWLLPLPSKSIFFHWAYSYLAWVGADWLNSYNLINWR